MKYITCREHNAIVCGEWRTTFTYLESIAPLSLVMSYAECDAMVFDTREEIRPTIIAARRRGSTEDFDEYRESDYDSENWVIKPITEKEVFVQRLTQ